MKHYRNTMEGVLGDIEEKIDKQNFSLKMYGSNSIEFQVARIILNTTLETLCTCNYILSYDFSMFENEIKEIMIIFGSSHKAFISDTDYEIY